MLECEIDGTCKDGSSYTNVRSTANGFRIGVFLFDDKSKLKPFGKVFACGDDGGSGDVV